MLNVATGNLLVQADDVDIPERGIDLAFRRTYNGQSKHDNLGTDGSLPSVFGNGWSSTFDAHVAYNGSVMSVYDIDGARYDYTPNPGGCSSSTLTTCWTPSPGMQGVTLQYDGGCGYEWTKKNGAIYYFAEPVALPQCGVTPPAAEFGSIQYIQGRNASNQINFTYSYSGNGSNTNQLTEIVAQHSDGDALALHFKQYNGYAELWYIVRPDNQQITYNYDQYNNLISVERPGNGTVSQLPESYSYTASTHNLIGAAGPRYTISYVACGSSPACVTDGDSVTFSYSGNALTEVQDYGVVNFTPADGISSGLPIGVLQPGLPINAQTWHTEEFAGDSGTPNGTSGGVTDVTDNFGHARAWTYDGYGRITETQEWTAPTSGAPLATNATWDTGNDMTLSIDVTGNQANYTYDANGNTLSVQEPAVQTSNGYGSPTSTYTYDAHNNLITYCDANYVWQHGASSCPASSSTAYYKYASTSTEAFGELAQTYDAVGYSYQLTYDNYGEPTSVQGATISQVDGTTRQPTQTFGYDGYGDLTSYNKGNGSWALTYDNMHRPLTHTDPDNHISYTYFNNDGSVSKTETAYQHANGWGSTATYDADGNGVKQTVIRQAAPTTSPAPETTSKYYDGADRLIEVVQPQDSNYDTYSNPWVTRYLYDLTGAPNLSFNGAAAYAAYGNLYKTQELLPPAAGPVTATAAAPLSIANTSFQDLKGTAYDALDRPVGKYSMIVANGGTSESLSAEVLTYDGTNEYGTFPGQLTSDCSALAQCKYPGYDSQGRQFEIGFSDSLSPSRTTSFDPDGHVISITSTAFGTQYYTYDADGHKLTEQEASGGGVTSPATFQHTYYADGKLEQLSVSASGLNQNGLFQYSYRADGLVQTQTINDGAQANVGSTSVAFTYYASGRPEQRSESGPGGNPNPTSWQYDTYGHVTQINYPACSSCGPTFLTSYIFPMYDPQDLPLESGYLSPGNSDYTGNQYSARGEYVGGAYTSPTTVAYTPPAPMYANGVNVPSLSATIESNQNSSYSATWDAQSGVILGKSKTTANFSNGMEYDTGSSSTFQYDLAGRLMSTAESETVPIIGGATVGQSDTLSRSYDDENHTVLSTDNDTSMTTNQVGLGTITAYNWGPTGHPIRVGSATGATSSIPSASAIQYDTLHWDGDQLIFESNSSGTVDDIKIGTSGDITPLDQTFNGLTFWDRGQSGNIVLFHNAAGTGLWSQLNTYSGNWGTSEASVTTGPTSFAWSSAPTSPYQMPSPQRSEVRYLVGVGQGALLGMYRTDGLTDGLNTLQGVRSYDPNAGTWTTPDAYAGDVHDPASQKSYMWNDNNPVTYSDPSGYCSKPVGTGTLVCIDFYIPTATALNSQGDNRGPTGTDRNATYRVEITISFSDQIAQAVASVSHNADGTNAGTGRINNFSATFDGDTVRVSVDASCGNCNSAGDLFGFRIRGDFTLGLNPDGTTVSMLGGSRSAYPAVEIWSYSANGVRLVYLGPAGPSPLVLPIDITIFPGGVDDEDPNTYGSGTDTSNYHGGAPGGHPN